VSNDNVQYHVDEFSSVGVKIVEAIAEVNEVEETEVTPLYTAVDVDALTDLFANTAGTIRTTGHVTFEVDDCQVTVFSDGTIKVVPVDEAPAIS
jgi:hypothetical protein